MNRLVEQYCKGTLRSYKTFRAKGDITMHTLQDFQEWNFDDNRILTISAYRQHRRNINVETDQWAITFSNKRYFIEIPKPAVRLELITINHTGMVIEDSLRDEKIFFARLPAWENLIRNGAHIL